MIFLIIKNNLLVRNMKPIGLYNYTNSSGVVIVIFFSSSSSSHPRSLVLSTFFFVDSSFIVQGGMILSCVQSAFFHLYKSGNFKGSRQWILGDFGLKIS